MQEEYQEIDLVELFKTILRKWWLILLCMAVFGAGAYYYTNNYMMPIYRAETTLFIGRDSGNLSEISIGEINLNSKLVEDYSQLIQTRLVTQEVVDSLGLNQSPESLIYGTNVSVIPDSRFMYVSYRDPIPERAEMIVNELSDVLVEKAEEVVGARNVMVVDYAKTPYYPISPNLNRNVMMGALVGAVIALGIIFLMILMDNTVKREDEIEKMLGVPVLGSIPKFKGAARS